MWSPTRYLDALMLATSVAPAELVRVLTSFGIGAANRRRLQRISVIGVPVAYGAICVLVALCLALAGPRGAALPVAPSRGAWLALALGVGVALFYVELLLALIPARMRRQKTMRVRVNLGTERLSRSFVASVLAVAFIEEVLYRGYWLRIIHTDLGWPNSVFVLLSAAAYALGHVFFGMTAVAQKLATGAVLGLLAVMSGGLAAPLVAHLSENVVVLFRAHRSRLTQA